MNDSIAVPNRISREFLIALAAISAVTALRLILLAFQTVPLSEDEAQYWNWAQMPDWGYFSKPPLLAWIIAATTAICGEGEACVRIAAPLLHMGTALTLFAVGTILFDRRAGMWSALIYVLLPGVSVSALLITTDVPLLLFWAVGLLCLIRARDTDLGWWWAALGAAVGLGLLSKYAMIYFVMGVAVYMAWTRDYPRLWRRPGVAVAAMVACVIYLPNLFWNVANSFASYRHIGANMDLKGPHFNPGRAAEFLVAQFGVFGPVTMAALLCVAWVLLRRPRAVDDRYRLLFSFTGPVLVLLTSQALLSRAYANWAATAYVAGAVLLAGWLQVMERTAVLKAALAIHILLATGLYNFEAIAAAAGISLNAKMDPIRPLRGWDRAGVWASGLQAQFPGMRFLFDDRAVMAPLMYYVRPHPFGAVMWNPAGQMNNYYEMTTDPMQHVGEDFIYVTRFNWLGNPDGMFESYGPMDVFTVSDYPGHQLKLQARVLHAFKGYRP